MVAIADKAEAGKALLKSTHIVWEQMEVSLRTRAPLKDPERAANALRQLMGLKDDAAERLVKVEDDRVKVYISGLSEGLIRKLQGDVDLTSDFEPRYSGRALASE